MKWPHAAFMSIMLATLACRTGGGPGPTAGSAVSSFSISKFVPSGNDPAWTKMDVVMARLDGDLKKIEQSFSAADFQSGGVQNQTIVIPQGRYNIELNYKGADNTVLYVTCASTKAKIYEINTPTFQADIAICKPGGNQVGTTTVTPNSSVTITPRAGDDGGTGTAQGNPMAPGPSFTSFATNFKAIGAPTGGCGVPEAQLDSLDYVALNVQKTPNDYSTTAPRPNPDQATTGIFANGLNCGRWVHVTITKDCHDFLNSGTTAQNLCPESKLSPSLHADASLDMIVADSCQDNNGWCRDDQYHLDLHTVSLTRFVKAGAAVDLSKDWANPQITWQFIKAPKYSGDIKIGFGAMWQKYYLPVIITHLENGLHAVEVKVNGAWQKATMNGDNGQAYVLPNTAEVPFQVRLYDADDKPVQGGRIYQFNLPSSCAKPADGGKCDVAYTVTDYKVIAGS